MSNEVSKDYKEQLALIFSKKFFFKKPEQNKIILYAILSLVVTLLGIYFGLWLVASIFVTFCLCYILAASGKNLFTMIASFILVVSYLSGGLYIAFWQGMHIILAVFFFIAIKNRFSKIFLVLFTTAFLFLVISVFLLILVKTNIISYSPQAIQNYLDAYMLNINSTTKLSTEDNAVFMYMQDVIKLYFPTILFAYIFIYALSLVQVVTKMLSRERAITPVYPKFSLLVIHKNVFYGYFLLGVLVLLLSDFFGFDKMSFEVILLENLLAILRWVVVFNGLITCYFLVDVSLNGNRFYKVLLSIAALIVSFVFEIIGMIEFIFNFRAYYIRSKGDK